MFYILIILSFVLAIACFAIWLYRVQVERDRHHSYSDHVMTVASATSNVDGDFGVPQRWDEQLISEQLSVLRNRQPALEHYVSSIMDRFVLRQSDQTARVRSAFLRTRLDQLKLAKDLHMALDDLTLHQGERDIRQRNLEIQRQELEHKQEHQQELDRLKHEREKLQINLEITRLSRQIEEEKKPAAAATSPQQERAKNRAYWEGEITRLRMEKVEKARATEASEDRVRTENMYDDAISRAEEQLRRYL